MNPSTLLKEHGLQLYVPPPGSEGEFLLKRLSVRFEARVKHYADQHRPGYGVRLIFADCSPPTPNAFATLCGGDTVVIYMGLLYKVIGRFSDVLDPNRVIEWTQLSRWSEQAPPADKTFLRKFRDVMSLFACEWVLMHELAHLWNGHVGFVRGRHGVTLIDELNMTSSGLVSTLDLQTLEMDADNFAMPDIVNTAMGEPWFRQEAVRLSDFFGLPRSRADETVPVYIAYFVMVSLMLLLEQSEADYAIDMHGSHPPLRLRRNYMLAQCTKLYDWTKFSQDQFSDICIKASMDAEVAFNGWDRVEADYHRYGSGWSQGCRRGGCWNCGWRSLRGV